MDNREYQQYPPIFIVAWIVAAIGAVSLVLTGIWRSPQLLEAPFFYIALSLLGAGFGEILNHPKVRSVGQEPEADGSDAPWHRRRNTCGLGNLLEIAAILLFFVGLGKFFSPY